MVTTRSGKTTICSSNNREKNSTTKKSARLKDLNEHKANSEPNPSLWRYPKCDRHPKGGVKCATCMRAGHTEASWEKATTKMIERRLAVPIEPKRAFKLPRK
uniref:Uncharacterized protein n=1 Tax=Ditylum brightwellii TaxID=49249 RepID=A0A7S4RVB2_9STRA